MLGEIGGWSGVSFLMLKLVCEEDEQKAKIKGNMSEMRGLYGRVRYLIL